MRTLGLVLALLALAGCGSYVQTVSRNATAGAVDGLTSPDATWKLDGLAAEASAAAVAGARDEALGPATTAELRTLVETLGASLREQLVLSRDQLLDKTLRAELARLVAEALGPATRTQVAALREEILGAPLRADVGALLEEAAPKIADLTRVAVQSALAPVKADAEAEASRYRDVAIGLGVGAAALLLALGLAVHEIREHRKALKSLLEHVVGRPKVAGIISVAAASAPSAPTRR